MFRQLLLPSSERLSAMSKTGIMPR